MFFPHKLVSEPSFWLPPISSLVMSPNEKNGTMIGCCRCHIPHCCTREPSTPVRRCKRTVQPYTTICSSRKLLLKSPAAPLEPKIIESAHINHLTTASTILSLYQQGPSITNKNSLVEAPPIGRKQCLLLNQQGPKYHQMDEETGPALDTCYADKGGSPAGRTQRHLPDPTAANLAWDES
jgi:hypothetical protein